MVSIQRDPQTMVSQLEAGSLDIADAPGQIDIARIGKDSMYRTLTEPSNTNVFGVNTGLPPTDNKLVRQAINYAIDRKRMVDSVYQGTGTAECLPWQPNSLAFEAAKNNFYTYDLDKAKSLLSQAGLSNASFDIVVASTANENSLVAQILQSALQGLGITATIKPYETAAYLDQINNHKYTGAYVGAIAYAAMEPISIISNSRHLDPSGNSNTAFKSDQNAQLYQSASTEPDAAKRKALYSQLNDLILDQSFIMPICSAPSRMITRAAVHDIGLSQHGAFLFNGAWLE